MVLAIQLLGLATKFRKVIFLPFQFTQCPLHADLNGYTINNEVLALSYLELPVSTWSICLLRDTEVTFVPAGRSFTTALQHRATAEQVPHTRKTIEQYWKPKKTYLSQQCWSLLTLALALRPGAAVTSRRCAGAPGWESCHWQNRQVLTAGRLAGLCWAFPCQRLRYLYMAHLAGKTSDSTLQWWIFYM